MFPPPLPPRPRLGLAPPAGLREALNRTIERDTVYPRKLDLNMDEKKLRRIISNRLSAYRSRARTNEYIKALEKRVKDLQNMVSLLTLQIDSYSKKRKELVLQNESLKKLVEFRFTESKISEIQLAQKRLEIGRLKEVVKATKSNDLVFYQNGLQKIVPN